MIAALPISRLSTSTGPRVCLTFDDDDADPCTATGQRFRGKAPDLGGDIPFDLTNILDTLQTMREDMAGIEDEKERRATTARFASEFVSKTMGVDGDERDEIEG